MNRIDLREVTNFLHRKGYSMTIFDRASLAVQLSLENYETFIELKDLLEQAAVKGSFLLAAYKPVFAADAASAMSDEDLREQLLVAYSATTETTPAEGMYGARFDLAKIRQVIDWVVANKDLIALLIKLV